MIVKSGRRLIKNGSFNPANLQLFLEKKTDDGVIRMTDPDDTYSGSGKVLINTTYTSNDLSISFTGNITGSGDNVGTYYAGGLVYNGNTLFSRFTFKDTAIDTGHSYNLEYIIYF